MFLRRLSIDRVTATGDAVPCPIGQIDNFAMRNFTNDAVFDDTLPIADGVLDAVALPVTNLTDYRLTNRGVKGVINMKTTKKTGNVVAILSVREDSELMIITREGKMIRIDSGEIRQAGRSTQGVRLVKLDENDQVAAASLIPESEEKALIEAAEPETPPVQ